MLCKAVYYGGYGCAMDVEMQLWCYGKSKWKGTPKVGIRKEWTGRRGEKPSGLLLGGLDFMCRLFCQILIIIIECEIEQ